MKRYRMLKRAGWVVLFRLLALVFYVVCDGTLLASAAEESIRKGRMVEV